MARLTFARTGTTDPIALDAVVEQLRSSGHDATVGPEEPTDTNAPNAQLVVRFLSDEGGADLARTAKHVLLAVLDVTGELPTRIAFYDRTGRLLNDTDESLR